MPISTLTVGQKVWVYATIFDTRTKKWSQKKFKSKANTTRLWGTVKSLKRGKTWVIHFPFDGMDMDVTIAKLNLVTEKYECTPTGLAVERDDIDEDTDEESGRSAPSEPDSEAPSGEESESEDLTPCDPKVTYDWVFEPLDDDLRNGLHQYTRQNAQLVSDASAMHRDGLIWFMWRKFFPHAYVNDYVILLTNAAACKDKEWRVPLTIGEFYVDTQSGNEIWQPSVAENWYKNYGKIDGWNHKRSDLERVLRVQSDHEFALFTGLLTFIENNMFQASKAFYPEDYGDKNHTEYRAELVDALINNPELEESHHARITRQDSTAFQQHTIEKSSSLKTCVICSRVHQTAMEVRSMYFCGLCTESAGHICRPGKIAKDGVDHKCWEYHLQHGLPKRTRVTKQRTTPY